MVSTWLAVGTVAGAVAGRCEVSVPAPQPDISAVAVAAMIAILLLLAEQQTPSRLTARIVVRVRSSQQLEHRHCFFERCSEVRRHPFFGPPSCGIGSIAYMQA